MVPASEGKAMSTPTTSPFPPTLPPGSDGAARLPECVPSLDDLVTEDHKPVDRIYIEKLYRLLTQPLYDSWPGPGPGRSFLVLANVGWFYKEKTPAVVPDCLLSLDVPCPEDLHTKAGHSYYQWLVGKPPEVVIEVVSDRTGGEDGLKKKQYARLGVAYYAVFDPEQFLSDEPIRIWQLHGRRYRRVKPGYWPEIGLGLVLWQGKFAGHTDTWLRWCGEEGVVVPTGGERADKAEERVRELEEALGRLQGPSPDQPPDSSR
jgi:Uma2 family endonuclease